jgi:hypothetical protein
MRPTSDRYEAGSEPDDAEGQNRRRPRRPRSTTAGTALFALVLIATACSSAPKSPGVAGSGPSTTAKAAASAGPQSPAALAEMTAYAKCMRSHGIADFPDPTANPGGPGGSFDISAGPGSDLNPDDPRNQRANQACQSLLPDGGQTPAPSAQHLAAEVKLATCIRNHGVANFPDPNGQGAFNLGEVDKNTVQFSTAIKTCKSLAKFEGPIPIGSSHQGP